MRRIHAGFLLVGLVATANAQGVGVGATVSLGARMLCSTPEVLNIFGGKLGLPLPRTAADKRYAGGFIIESASVRYRVLAIITMGDKRIAFVRTLPPAQPRTGWTFADELQAK